MHNVVIFSIFVQTKTTVMRKNLLLLFLCVLFALTSCTKDNGIGDDKKGNFDETVWEGTKIVLERQYVFTFYKGTVLVQYSTSQFGSFSSMDKNYTYEYKSPYLYFDQQGIIYWTFTYQDGKLIDQDGDIFTRKK